MSLLLRRQRSIQANMRSTIQRLRNAATPFAESNQTWLAPNQAIRSMRRPPHRQTAPSLLLYFKTPTGPHPWMGDLSDEQWQLIEPLLPLASRVGRPRQVSRGRWSTPYCM